MIASLLLAWMNMYFLLCRVDGYVEPEGKPSHIQPGQPAGPAGGQEWRRLPVSHPAQHPAHS